MRSQRGSVVLGLIVILAVLYFLILRSSMGGWGYAGYYRGTTYYPSFWYFGGPRYYTGPSVRTGSVGGSSPIGRGPSAGK
jgi:hypothetical protein